MLIAGVILANVVCWVIAGLTFSHTDGLVNLAFLAWVSLVLLAVLISVTDSSDTWSPTWTGRRPYIGYR